MRSIRMRVFATFMVLAAAGVGAWQLLPDRDEQGKTITVGTTDAVTSLDPAGAYDAGSWALYSNVFQSLLTFDAGGAAPVPDAAKHCGFVGQGLRTYRCELRDGLTFPSGRAVTAKDVKFSFDRVRAINSPVGPASLLDTLGKVETSGARTVTFRLSSPDATFPFKVATGAGSIVDSTQYPAHSLRTRTRVDGTGPYRLSSYTPGKQAKLVPNARYQGAVKNVGEPTTLRYFKDSAALESAWKARSVDVAARQLPPRCSPRTRRATRGSGSPRSRARRPGTSSSTSGRAARCTTAGCGRPSPRSSTGTGWSPRRTKAPSTPSTP